MVRSGLGGEWSCLFANDFDHRKCESYRRNWGNDVLHAGDVRALSADDLPGLPNLVWASFPCQDLSLAGAGAGLKGERSGTFWPFLELMRGLVRSQRAPEIIALENVVGTLHSHSGKDFEAICQGLHGLGYRFGAAVIDASLFVPQSRPRLFVIAVRKGVSLPEKVIGAEPSPLWHSTALHRAYSRLPDTLRNQWIWWDLPAPDFRESRFADLVEDNPSSVAWHTRAETAQLLSMMSPLNREKVDSAKRLSKQFGCRMVGTVYKRTRVNQEGFKVQRAEVRFDDVAGCLRTPAGGSSRQLILVVDGSKVRSRLISSRETARLMGLPESYSLPKNYNEAYHLTGDGVAVPVVTHIARHIFIPILERQSQNELSTA